MALTISSKDDSLIQVHLGANFPIILTSGSALVDGRRWYEAEWETPGRSATGWLPSSAVTTTKPDGAPGADIDALDEALSKYLDSFGTRVGVAVYDVTRDVHYGHNADRPYFVASSIKVPIMLTLLGQLEAHKRSPNATEMSLLTDMIEYSDNQAANKLYIEVGYQRGIAAFLKRLGITELQVGAAMPWGYSTFTPGAMVKLLARLENGTILNEADRALALGLMHHITPSQRVGVGDSSPAGAAVWMKDGWITAPSPGGPTVMNTSGIVTLGAETYIISVYTDRDRNYEAGFTIVRHVCQIVGERLMGKA